MSRHQVLPRSDRLIVEASACLGCKTCTLVCSLIHDGEFNPAHAWLRVAKNPMDGAYNPIVCRQCIVPACYYACLTEGAMVIDDKTGARMIVKDKCITCGRCYEACLLGMIVVNPSTNTYGKCDLCGGAPVCVKYCPTKAIKYDQRGR
jgi:Fe-S-cluster-containing hydrogenase component 2